jgi:hypothetical protein
MTIEREVPQEYQRNPHVQERKDLKDMCSHEKEMFRKMLKEFWILQERILPDDVPKTVSVRH